MKQKKIVWMLFAFLILTFVILFFIDANKSNFCMENGIENDDCISQINHIGEPIFWSFLSLLLIIPILFFVRHETFLAWAKFAGIGFPLMIATLIYIFNYGDVYHSFGGGGLFSSDAEAASIILPVLFFLISLAIISVKSWKLRKDKITT